MYGEAYSTSSLRGTEHAFRFNFIVCRELVMTVNMPLKEEAWALKKAFSIFVVIYGYCFLYCIYCASAPSLHGESTY